MIDCEYNQNYRGPDLTFVQIWKNGENKIDITDNIRIFYGDDNNWCGKLYTFHDIFPGINTEHKFYVEFVDKTGRKHWFYGLVGEPNQYFTPPLAIPMNQNNI